MNELQTTTNGLMPQTQAAKFEMATVLCKSGLIPNGLNTPEKVFVALQWGHELGLSPMVAVNNVAVINGKPTLSADIMAAVVKRSPEYGGIEWKEISDTKAECEISRILPNGKVEKITSCFTIEDARNAGLVGKDVWRKYPKRMLKHRCLSYGLKDMFPDLLAGLYTPEEMETVEVQEREPINITPNKEELEPKTEDVKKQNNFKIASETQSDDYSKLSEILETHKADINPKYYDACCTALTSGDAAEINDKLNRVVAYLGKKGIKVA